MKKLFRCLLTLSFSVTALSACSLEEFFGGDSSSSKTQKVADHIEVRDYTESVIKGKEYTFDGKVFAIYENENEEEVTKDCKFDYSTFDTSSIGKTKFKVTYEDAKYIHSKSVYIDVIKDPYVALKSISLSETIKVRLSSGAKTITPTFTPSNASNKEVEWSIADTSIATVSSDGVVTPKAIGDTTITVTSKENSSIEATANLNVHNNAQDEWTILMYVCGSNLESQGEQATADLEEIASVSSQPDDVNIVIQAGGANSWSSTYSSVISANKRNRFHLKNKSYVSDGQASKVNMGLESSLQEFIEWGVDAYPADKIGLIFWNHGSGIDGCCLDEQFSDDGLTPIEVSNAIKAARTSTGAFDKLEFIGYDCCLMQIQDIAGLNSEYAKYQIASCESEWGKGWSYHKWVDDLFALKSTEDILTAVVDSFGEDTAAKYQSIYGEPNNSTLSFLDLSKWSAYETAWEDMSSTLSGIVNSSSKWNTFSSFLNNDCYKYGVYEEYGYISYPFDLFDVGSFCTKIKTNDNYKDKTTLINKVNVVSSALSELVVHQFSGVAVTSGSGLALFAPVSGYNSKSSYPASVTTLSTWRNICINYGSWYTGYGY